MCDINEYTAPLFFKKYTIDEQCDHKNKDFMRLCKLKNIVPVKCEYIDSSECDINQKRNKAKLTFGYMNDINVNDINVNDINVDNNSSVSTCNSNVIIGMKCGKYPNQKILKINGSILFSKEFSDISETILKCIVESKVPIFKNKILNENNGVWKYVTIRHSIHQNSFIVVMHNYVKYFAINKEYHETLQKIFYELKNMPHINVSDVYIQEFKNTFECDHNDNVTKIINNNENLFCEKINEKLFVVQPTSFLQTNIYVTQMLYNTIRDICKNNIVNDKDNNILIDLYCGIGTIGINVNDIFCKIFGVDCVQSSIDDAIHNAKINNVKNVSYFCHKCENITGELTKIINDCETNNKYVNIVVNPSRSGLHKKIKKFIIESNIQNVIYSSCNSVTWMNDVNELKEKYEISYVKLFDMFPNTPHYELVSFLIKK